MDDVDFFSCTFWSFILLLRAVYSVHFVGWFFFLTMLNLLTKSKSHKFISLLRVGSYQMQIRAIPFISFSWLMALSEHPSHILNFRGNSFRFPTCWNDFIIPLGISWSFIVFTMLRYDQCIPPVIYYFIITMLIFSKVFLYLRWLCDFCSWLYLSAVYIHLFVYVELSLYPWNEANLYNCIIS
jgi:hypothetical protein